MSKTTKYDVAEHLRTPEEMAAYLEACMETAPEDAAFIAKALGDITRAKGMTQVARDSGIRTKASTKPFPANATQPSIAFRKSPAHLVSNSTPPHNPLKKTVAWELFDSRP